jgi:hypothetical protein
MQPDYQTIFEIGWRSFPWGGLFHDAPFIILGVFLFRFSRSKQIYEAVGLIVAILATLFLLLSASSYVPEFVSQRGAYRNGDSSVVVGTVENFNPAPPLGAAKESFSVHGIIFSYYVGNDAPCFNNAPAYKGPIRQGSEVRIYYKGDCIQRVDIHQ